MCRTAHDWNRGNRWTPQPLGRNLALTVALLLATSSVAQAVRVTVYTNKESFLLATKGRVATEGAGGAAGELPWRGVVGADGDDVLVGDVRFRIPEGGGFFLGTDSAHGDWTPLIPGPDLAPPAGAGLEVGLVNRVAFVHAMGVDLATGTSGPVELEVTLLAGDEVVHSFEHRPDPGVASFLGVWSDTPFDVLRIRHGSTDRHRQARSRAFFGPVYVSEEGLAPGAPKTLTPSDMATAGFGRSVAASGDVAVVGAPGGNEVAAGSGSAYVFERNEGGADNWGEVKHLLASDAEAGDKFGGAVAVSGDVIAVGARDEDELDDDAGTVYLFERDHGGPGDWGEVKKLLASDGAAVDRFGTSVAVSGDVVVVGSPRDDNPSGGQGSAYVFERDHGGPENWGEIQKLRPSETKPGITFGDAVAVSGHRIVVGAQGSTEGTLYLFERDAGGAANWGEVAALHASDPVSGDSFGERAALGLDVLVGGAPDHEHGGIDAGSAYVFERSAGGSGSWGEVAELLPVDPLANDDFGDAVSVSGDVVLVGVPLDDDGGTSSGSSYLYERDHGGTGNWGQVAKPTDPNPSAGDQFGNAVAVSGDVALVGAPGAGTQGRAILFGLTGPCNASLPTGLVLTRPTVDTTEVFEACYTIEAFSEFGVAASGNVTLRAGKRVVLGDGFAVAAGGALVVEIDPAVGE